MWGEAGGYDRVNTSQAFIFKDHEIVCRKRWSSKFWNVSNHLSPSSVILYTLCLTAQNDIQECSFVFCCRRKAGKSSVAFDVGAFCRNLCFTFRFCSSKVLDLHNTQVSLLSGSETLDRSMISGFPCFAHGLDHLLSHQKLSDEGRQLLISVVTPWPTHVTSLVMFSVKL